MDDIAHIALVDAHAECIRRRHDGRTVVGEILLRLSSFLVFHSCMVSSCADAGTFQKVMDLIDCLSRRTVNDAAFLLVRLHVPEEQRFLVRITDDAEGQVRPVESGAEDFRMRKPQALLHILFDSRRRGRCERRDDRFLGKGIDEGLDLPVRRAEIMAPLGDAVRLIDDDHGNRHLREAVSEVGRFQLFRCHVKDLDAAPVHVAQALDRFIIRHRAIHVRSQDALLRQRLHLILHEGNQGRDDDGPVRKHHGRYLKTDGFPGARRHDCQNILLLQDRGNDFLLYRPERIVAKILLQHFTRRHAHPPSPAAAMRPTGFPPLFLDPRLSCANLRNLYYSII